MSDEQSELKAARIGELMRRLSHLSGAPNDTEVFVFWVPGRIEVLGKHTDYGGGRSLLCAVERGICLVARARSDTSLRSESPTVRIMDANSDDIAEFDLAATVDPRPGH